MQHRKYHMVCSYQLGAPVTDCDRWGWWWHIIDGDLDGFQYNLNERSWQLWWEENSIHSHPRRFHCCSLQIHDLHAISRATVCRECKIKWNKIKVWIQQENASRCWSLCNGFHLYYSEEERKRTQAGNIGFGLPVSNILSLLANIVFTCDIIEYICRQKLPAGTAKALHSETESQWEQEEGGRPLYVKTDVIRT